MISRWNHPAPFAIVADLRTGSTLLASSLDRHPEIRCHGEIFHPDDLPDNGVPGHDRRQLTAATLLRKVLSEGDRGVRAAGFRAMVFLPVRSRPWWPDAWRRLAEVPDLRVIYLTREHRLAQYVSLLIARELGVFHPSSDDPALDPQLRPTIRVDPSRFRAWLRGRQRLESLRRRQLAGKRSLEIGYSDLADDWARTIRRIQAFLGVLPLPLEPAKQKQEHRPLRSVVENYSELVAELEDSVRLG